MSRSQVTDVSGQDVSAQAHSKRRRKKPTGRVIKISHFLANYLRKRGSDEESFDSILRRQFGLKSRKGALQSLQTYYVIPGACPQISLDLADARGRAIIAATKKGLKKATAVIMVREVPCEPRR